MSNSKALVGLASRRFTLRRRNRRNLKTQVRMRAMLICAHTSPVAVQTWRRVISFKPAEQSAHLRAVVIARDC
jgi:hypothetical protein